VVVDHLGLGAIAFEAASSAVWLNASPGSGQSVDTLTVTIDTTGLTAGSHFGTLFIVDSVTRDSSVSVSVRVDVTPAASTDTLAIGTTQTAPLAQGVVFVDAFLNADIERLLLPIGYDSTLVTIDSIVLTTSLPTGMTFGYDIDSVDQAARLWLFNDDPDSSLAAGYHPLAEIYYTTGSSLGTNPLNAIAYDTNLVHVVRAGGQRRTPAVIAGQITVDDQTPVGDDLPGGLPQKLVLDPNYPNPFNATTTIEFSLPAAAPVTLEVFKILGQRVAILVDELRPVGRYIEVWDGRVGDGEPSTGIYFYRLRAGEQEQIRKMLLLK